MTVLTSWCGDATVTPQRHDREPDMPKRGQTQPWRLRTTWAHADIKPFTETFPTEDAVLRGRQCRMATANLRDDNRESVFEITHRERPDYTAPEAPVCKPCAVEGIKRWGTEYNPMGTGDLCVNHTDEAWDLYHREHGL